MLSALGLVAAFFALRDLSGAEPLQPRLEAKEPAAEPADLSAAELAEFEAALAEATQLTEEHRYREARPLLASARALRPEAAEAHFQTALNEMGLRDYASAEAALDRTLALEPDNARYVLGMAQLIGHQLVAMEDSFAKLGLASKGKRLIDRAIELDGELVDARLARLLYCMMAPSLLGGGVERAREEVRTITAIDEAVGQFAAAWLAEQEEDWSQAEELYRSSLELDPDYPRTHHRLGHLLLGQERYLEALTHFEAGLALEPRSPASHEGVGLALAGLGRMDEALAAFRRALAIDPDFDSAHFGEAECLLEQSANPDEVRLAFTRFLELASPGDDERIERAQAWLEQHAPAR